MSSHSSIRYRMAQVAAMKRAQEYVVHQAELACSHAFLTEEMSDEQREAYERAVAERNTPEEVKAHAARLARAKRRRRAAERGARTIQREIIDMAAFEAQFTQDAP